MSDSTGIQYEREERSRRNNAELVKLRWHWDSAYRVSVDWPDAWRAERLDDGTPLTAQSAGELNEAMRADYAARPVPRRDDEA